MQSMRTWRATQVDWCILGLVWSSKSSKQKLNTKSSTKLEQVGVSKYLLYHIWLMNFLSIQDLKVDKRLLSQDNQSTIRMERNGWNLCTGNSRHIDIRYLFIKDWVQSGEIDIKYYPSEDMVADFFYQASTRQCIQEPQGFHNGTLRYNWVIRQRSQSISIPKNYGAC